MATDGMAGFWDGIAYPAQAERLLDTVDGMPGPASAPFSARSGRRVNGAGLAVSVSSTGNGSVTVSPGAGQIYSSAHTGQGRWKFYIPNSVGPLALGARPAPGQSRVDLVVAQLYDSGNNPVVRKEVKIEVVPGQAGVTPSAPALPALSMLLDTLTVGATGTISHSQSTDVVVAAGGILPVATTAAMNKLKTDGIAYRGLVVDNAQTDSLHRYDGTNWKRQVDADSFIFGDTKWGVAYNPAIHEPLTYANTIVGTTTPGGILTVIPDLSAMFAGISTAPMGAGDQVGGLRYVSAVPNTVEGVTRLEAYCYVAAGSGVVSQTVRVDVTVHGWR